jgi:hypothetical protein
MGSLVESGRVAPTLKLVKSLARIRITCLNDHILAFFIYVILCVLSV